MYRLLSVLLALAFFACGDEASKPPLKKASQSSLNSHQKMVDTLSAIAKSANPMKFYNLNAKRAKILGE